MALKPRHANPHRHSAARFRIYGALFSYRASCRSQMGACMKWWFAIWIGFALFMMVSALDLNWMGAAYLKLHHLIAIGTADFFATWTMLLVPPLVLWYGGVGILVLG